MVSVHYTCKEKEITRNPTRGLKVKRRYYSMPTKNKPKRGGEALGEVWSMGDPDAAEANLLE